MKVTLTQSEIMQGILLYLESKGLQPVKDKEGYFHYTKGNEDYTGKWLVTLKVENA